MYSYGHEGNLAPELSNTAQTRYIFTPRVGIRKEIRQTLNSIKTNLFLRCPLCQKPTDLTKDLTTDEHGQSVHEGCYLESICGAPDSALLGTVKVERQDLSGVFGHLTRLMKLLTSSSVATMVLVEGVLSYS